MLNTPYRIKNNNFWKYYMSSSKNRRYLIVCNCSLIEQNTVLFFYTYYACVCAAGMLVMRPVYCYTAGTRKHEILSETSQK